MVSGLITHELKWLAPAPLWKKGYLADTTTRNGSPGQPTILRFDNDLFMEEMLSLLAYHPELLLARVAKPETWEKPMTSPATPTKAEVLEPISEFSKKVWQQRNKGSSAGAGLDESDNRAISVMDKTAVDALPFKLYQPGHRRFYLVAASLICRQVGMPDWRIDAGKQEVAGFVLRRVRYTEAAEESKKEYDATDTGWSEYAYTAKEDGFAWKSIPLSKRPQIQDGEERLPLFALNFKEQGGHPRRMLAGLIPVGKREAYLSAPEQKENQIPVSDKDSRKEKAKNALQALFEAQVIAPWKALIEQAKVTHDTVLSKDVPLETGNSQEKKAKQARSMIKEAREKIQTASWYILLDFAKFLEKNLDAFWKGLKGEDAGRSLTDQEEALIIELKDVTIKDGLKDDLIKGTTYNKVSQIASSLADALLRINTKETEAGLEAIDVPYDRQDKAVASDALDARWPSFLFPLCDPGVKVDDSQPWNVEGKPDLAGPLDIYAGTDWSELADELGKIDALGEFVQDALPETIESVPDIQIPQQPLDPSDGWFVIRCVYEQPNCGPLKQAVVSRPTEKFQMAAFFDPDAPVREVRVSLPADISPAGLRKYKKNATLMMSDMLCGKIKGIRKMTFGDLVLSVLPWPFHKDLPDVGQTGPCKEGTENFGMYCSLSIPIVTLVALILMIIMVSLFDIFFRWIPYLFMCFPIPGFKAKKAGGGT
jgi:hypothetical protein